VSKLFPVTPVGMLHRSHCLFLGYSLRDWDLRVILNRIWGDETLRAKFWAAEPEHQDYLERYPNDYTCHFPRPGWVLPKRSAAAR
jgi:hypothetical protein